MHRPNSIPASAVLLASLALGAILPGDAAAAESYANCTGFIDSVPAAITTQGVWCLRADLATAINNGSAISVNTNNVTIECNDFKLGGLAAGLETQATGVSANNRQNVTIRGCAIRGFARAITIFGADTGGHLVERNRLDSNRWFGMVVQGDGSSMIRDNRVVDTGGAPDVNFTIGITGSANIINNTVDGVSGAAAHTQVRGISASSVHQGLVVSGNRVRGLTASGGPIVGILAPSAYTHVMNNQVTTNTVNVTHYGIMTSQNDPHMAGGNRVSGFATPYFGQPTFSGANYSN